MDIQPDFSPKGKVGLAIDFPAFWVHPARGVNFFEREVPIVHAREFFLPKQAFETFVKNASDSADRTILKCTELGRALPTNSHHYHTPSPTQCGLFFAVLRFCPGRKGL
jgi:hypothetical protein